MALNDLGVEVPASTDAFDPDGDMRELGGSLEGRIIVPVANTTARDALATTLSPSATEPLFVWRADANIGSRLEWTEDGSTWQAGETSHQPAAANIAALPALGDFGGQQVYVEDVDIVVIWNGTSWIPRMFAEATGQVTISGSSIGAGAPATAAEVVFPVGLFTQPPRLSIGMTAGPGGSANVVARASAVTAEGCDILAYNTGAAATSWTGLTIDWHAVQALSTGSSS